MRRGVEARGLAAVRGESVHVPEVQASLGQIEVVPIVEPGERCGVDRLRSPTEDDIEPFRGSGVDDAQ